MDEKILSLPWQIQVSLGAGYVAYLLAYAGIRDHHKGIDVPFRAISFGLVATLMLYVTSDLSPVFAILSSSLVTVFSGILWRMCGIPAYRCFLRKFRISWADDTPSAWSKIALENTKYTTSQLAVNLQDGSWVKCSNVHRVSEWPNGPFVLGNNGDVAMYIDKVSYPDKSERDFGETISVDGWGKNMTFIPAQQVRQIKMRLVEPEVKASRIRKLIERFKNRLLGP